MMNKHLYSKDKQHGNLFNTYKILQACHVVRIIKDLFQPSNSLLVVQDTFDAKLNNIWNKISLLNQISYRLFVSCRLNFLRLFILVVRVLTIVRSRVFPKLQWKRFCRVDWQALKNLQNILFKAKQVFSSFGRKGSDNCLAPSIVASHCAKIEVLKLAFIFHRWIQQFRI